MREFVEIAGGTPEDIGIVENTPSFPIDDEIFFGNGSIELHFPAPRGNDTQLTRAEAAVLTRAANQAETLRANFIDNITPVFRRTIPGKGMVQIMVPSSPYAYGGVMVVAAGDALVATERAELANLAVPTETAFDLHPDMRHEYYRQILASIQTEEDITLPHRDENTKVIAFENTVPSISNDKHRLPRTIALPHVHIIKGGDWINESAPPPRPNGFGLEQRISQDKELFAKFNEQWFTPSLDHMHLDPSEQPSLEIRNNAPYGYTIASKIARAEPLEKQAQAVSDLLTTHHVAYSGFAIDEAQNIDKRRSRRREEFMRDTGVVLPMLRSVTETLPLQPSYRTYLYYREDYLTVTISPMFITTLGAMEGMETAVDRSQHHEKIFTNEELASFFVNFSDHLRSLLEPPELR